MYKQLGVSLLLGAVLAGSGLTAVAADQDRDRLQTREHRFDQDQQRLQQRDRIDGWNLMSEQERRQYRERMQHLETREERERFRDQQHELMMQRMRQRDPSMAPPTRQRMQSEPPRGGGSGRGGPGGGGPGAGGGRR